MQPDTADIEKSIAKYNSSLSTLTIVSVIILLALVYLAITITPEFAWGLFILLPLLAAVYYFSLKRKKLKSFLEIRNEWGVKQLKKDRIFDAARLLFDYYNLNDNNSNRIDDQTWKDLNMEQLYGKIDRCHSDPGEAMLYNMLRTPLFDKEELAARNEIIRAFQSNSELREQVQLEISKLGHQFVKNDIFPLLWRDSFPESGVKTLALIMAVVAIVSVFIPAIFQSATLILVPVAVFIINLLIHYFIKQKKDRSISTTSFPYLISLIKTAAALSKIKEAEIEGYTGRLEQLSRDSRQILKKARYLFPTDTASGDPALYLLEYLNIFLLLEVRSFYATTGEMARNIDKLREIYLIIGELDALLSIASYRDSLDSYCEPQFDQMGINLEMRDSSQPLLENAVPASIKTDKNVVIITGSNMGGKSTFLRNIGCNVLMSQTVCTAVASYYRGSFFRIISSISRTDDLMEGKSFYYAEAERILKAIRSFSDKIPTLCLIDELLSGTNSTERLHASEAIIRYLCKQNTLAIIATHDLELADRLNGSCDFYHFTDNVDETGLKFDYLLKPGIAKTRNAIALLKYMGYPNEITQEADTGKG
jgi:DNA mismatch repair ATPase MutS